MAKILLLVILSLVSCATPLPEGAKHQWTLHSSSEKLDFKNYIDFSSVEINDSTRIFWTLTNYGHPIYTQYSEKKYLSALLKEVVDCNRRSLANISLFYYANTDATGEIIFQRERDINKLVFTKAIPRSGLDMTIQKVCALSKS